MGHCLLVYDISHDRTRTRVADACLDYGLDRIQYSAFLGTLSTNHQEELMIVLEELLEDRAGNIQLYPLCERDWRSRLVILQEGDDGGEDEDESAPVDGEPDAPGAEKDAAEPSGDDEAISGLADVDALDGVEAIGR